MYASRNQYCLPGREESHRPERIPRPQSVTLLCFLSGHARAWLSDMRMSRQGEGTGGVCARPPPSCGESSLAQSRDNVRKPHFRAWELSWGSEGLPLACHPGPGGGRGGPWGNRGDGRAAQAGGSQGAAPASLGCLGRCVPWSRGPGLPAPARSRPWGTQPLPASRGLTASCFSLRLKDWCRRSGGRGVEAEALREWTGHGGEGLGLRAQTASVGTPPAPPGAEPGQPGCPRAGEGNRPAKVFQGQPS